MTKGGRMKQLRRAFGLDLDKYLSAFVAKETAWCRAVIGYCPNIDDATSAKPRPDVDISATRKRYEDLYK